MRWLAMLALIASACATTLTPMVKQRPPAYIMIAENGKVFQVPFYVQLPDLCNTKDLAVTESGGAWVCIEGVWYLMGPIVVRYEE